jgi:hypothetical protein
VDKRRSAAFLRLFEKKRLTFKKKMTENSKLFKRKKNVETRPCKDARLKGKSTGKWHGWPSRSCADTHFPTDANSNFDY